MMTTSEYEKTFIERIHDQGIAEGEARGEAKGKTEGKAEAVLRLLSERPADREWPSAIDRAGKQEVDEPRGLEESQDIAPHGGHHNGWVRRRSTGHMALARSAMLRPVPVEGEAVGQGQGSLRLPGALSGK
jgi:hypothetical protein